MPRWKHHTILTVVWLGQRCVCRFIRPFQLDPEKYVSTQNAWGAWSLWCLERWLQPGHPSDLGCSIAAGEEAPKLHPPHNILTLKMSASLKVRFWHTHQNKLFSAGLQQLWAG